MLSYIVFNQFIPFFEHTDTMTSTNLIKSVELRRITDEHIVHRAAKHSDVLWERHLVSGAYFRTYNFSGRYWPWSYIFSQWKYVVSPERAFMFICRGIRKDFWTFLWFSCVFFPYTSIKKISGLSAAQENPQLSP